MSMYADVLPHATAVHEHGCVQINNTAWWIFHIDGRTWIAFQDKQTGVWQAKNSGLPPYADVADLIRSLIGDPL